MTISGIDTTSTTYTSSTTNAQSQEDQFLQLLVTQIQNQDPLDPMDNAEFTSQLTQLSTLDELETVNANLQENLNYTRSLNNTMMLGLVGRSATVSGADLSVDAGDVTSSSLQVDGAGTARIRVLDESGIEIATFTEQVSSGLNDITWNGLTDTGETAGDGLYSLEIEVTDSQGDALAFAPFMEGLVSSVRFENNMAVFDVNGQDYHASEILEIGM